MKGIFPCCALSADLDTAVLTLSDQPDIIAYIVSIDRRYYQKFKIFSE